MPYKDKNKLKEYQKQHYIDNKDSYKQASKKSKEKLLEHIRELKEKSGCVDCKSILPYYCLQFDHRDPTEKIASISEMRHNVGADKVLVEIEKCDIVCANCHAIRTFKQMSSRKDHNKSFKNQ